MPTITINIARRGPSFSGGGYAEIGRMWYSLTDSNGISSSYGFAPGHGAAGIDQALGAGQAQTPAQDDDLYQGTREDTLELAKTIEITQAQYEAMQSYGLQPEHHGLDINYNEISNKGIAFTWEAIQLAELDITDFSGWGRQLFGDATPLDADSFAALAQEDNKRDGQVKALPSRLTADNGRFGMFGMEADEQLTGSTGNDPQRGGSGNDTLIGGRGKDNLYGGAGNDLMFGGAGKDTLQGGTGNDTLFGDAGKDSLQGGTGNDIMYGGTGKDTLYGGTGNDMLYGGTGKDSLYGGAGNDILFGGTGKDSLHGGAGNDMLYGGTGRDTLTNISETALFHAGRGDDTLTGGASAELYLGGQGNDTYTTGTGHDVILFNKGDGQDTLAAEATTLASVTRGTDSAGSATLSLGGVFAYSDLSLSKSHDDLILKVGESDQLTFQDWYAAYPSRSVVNLQVITEAMTDFNAGGSNPLSDHKVETFDFSGLVDDFDAARTAPPALHAWSLCDALLKVHLAGYDSAAFGGDLAYRYGKNGSLSGLSQTAMQGVINDPRFGKQPQTLQSVDVSPD